MAKPKAKWNKVNIREMLEAKDDAVVRGLVRIHSFQTGDEQLFGQTTEENGVGWNGADAEYMTSLHDYFRANGYLTPGQMTYARKKILKYAGQLACIANNDVQAKENGYPTDR
jgi:hypothetical protein